MQYINIQLASSDVHPSLIIIEKIWPIIQSLFTKFGDKLIISESLSRFCRHFLESTQIHSGKILPLLFSNLISTLQRTKLSCYIWVCSKVVRVYGPIKEYHIQMGQLLQEITTVVFEIVQNPNKDCREPELGIYLLILVIEEYHFLLTQFIDSCPELIMTSDLINSTFQCALYCISNDNGASIAAILQYLLALFEIAKTRSQNLDQLQIQSVQSLIQNNGTDLLRSLLRGLIYSFERDRGIISDVAELLSIISLVCTPAITIQMISVVIEEFPLTEMPLEHKSSFLEKISR